MENLFIQGSGAMPTIDFRADGNLIIEGKAIPEDANMLFDPIFEWIDRTTLEKLVFDINLYYFNTAVSKQLYEMFMKVNKKETIRKVEVKWRYEEGDDDSLESGQIYQDEIPGFDFEFLVYAEAK